MSITRRAGSGSGTPGVAGESAYQLWLDAGHTGTVADFLASLVGAPGSPGSGSGTGPVWLNVKSSPYNATGNGTTDDRAAIQAAIDAAQSAGGGTVYLPKGVYALAGRLIARSGVLVIGDGKFAGCVLKPTGNGYSAIENNASTPGTAMTGGGFRGFEIDGSAQTGPFSVSSKGFFLTHCIDVVWDDLYVHDTAASGIGVDFLQDCEVTRNTAVRCGRLGTTSSPGCSGIGIGAGRMPTESVLVTGNHCIDNKRYGIFIERQTNATTQSLYWRCEGNHCRGNYIGIGDSASQDGSIVNNTCPGNALAGISVEKGNLSSGRAGFDLMISGNQCAGATDDYGSGIFLNYNGQSAGNVGRVQVHGNRLTGNRNAGLWARTDTLDVSDLDVTCNVISGNGNASTGGPGIQLTATNAKVFRNCRITGNKINGNRGSGIALAGDCVDCTVDGNDCHDEGAGTQTYALTVSNTFTGGSISGNDFRGNVNANPVLVAGSISATTRLSGNPGWTPPAAGSVTAGASPWTYTAGPVPEWLLVAGTVTGVTVNGVAYPTVGALPLEPGDAAVVTYTGSVTASTRRR